MSTQRSARKTVVGTVVSDKMHKTISVREERLVPHPMYGKYVRRDVVYKAHDEGNQARAGDVVEIAFTRPLSKTKNWKLVRILRSGALQAVLGEEDREAAAAPAPRAPEARETQHESDEASAEDDEEASS
jgi:small subunit ribosomal protein S17